MPRYWKIRNKSTFVHAKIIPTGNFQNNLVRLNLFGKDNKLPTWKLACKSRNYNLDHSHILNLLKATSYTIKPTCIITWKGIKGKGFRSPKCKILSSEGIDNGTAYSLQKNTIGLPSDGHLSLFIRLPRNVNVPDTIKKVRIIINGQLLPRKQFQYAICDSLRAEFVKCTDFEYLQNPGPAIVPFTGVSDDRESCSAYYIRPYSNLKSYCKFAVR